MPITSFLPHRVYQVQYKNIHPDFTAVNKTPITDLKKLDDDILRELVMEDEAKQDLDKFLKELCPAESKRITVTPPPQDYLIVNPDMADAMRAFKKPNVELEESDFQKLLPNDRLDQSQKLEVEHSNGKLTAPQKIKEELNPFLTKLRSSEARELAEETRELADQQRIEMLEARKKAFKASAAKKHKPYTVRIGQERKQPSKK